ALAVTAATRCGLLPEVPAVGELLPGYEASTWFGIGAPRGTPAAVIDMLNKETNAGLRDAETSERLAEQGGAVLPGSPAEFAALIADETEKWGRVVKFAGARVD